MAQFNNLFYSRFSLRGFKKSRLLAKEPVVLPFFASSNPWWRITWEQLQYHVRHSIAEHAAIMRSMPGGTGAADAIERAPIVSAAQYFIDFVHAWIEAKLPGFPVEYGFDVDLFLVVHLDPYLHTSTTEIYCEIFPRLRAGVSVGAFGSDIILPTAQWLLSPGRSEDSSLQGILFKERMDEGADMNTLFHQFGRFHGRWRVTTSQWIRLFIERLCYSIVFPHLEGQVLVASGNAQYEGTKPLGASFQINSV